VRIALVQPGDIADPAERLTAHAALTAEVGRTGGSDLVVWGQSSVTGDPARQPAVEGVLRRAAVDAGVDVLVNGKAGNPAAPSNTSWLYTPDGARGTYDKRLLVPFGEYVPLRPVLGWLEGFTPATDVDRVPGAGPVAMRSAGVTIGPLISYESAFPGLRRELARLGVDLTVVQGSLGTFQGSWLHAQQAAMEAVRAVETGRPAVLGAMSGTSAAFDARGRLLLWEPHDVTGAFVVTVPLVRVDTPYVRVGDWALWMAAAVVAWTAGAAVLRRATRHRAGTPRRPWSTAGGRTR
jgi:apolipoprotein N-acyltransferase